MKGTTGSGSYPVMKDVENLPAGYIAVWRFMDSSDLGIGSQYAYMYEDGYLSNKVNNRDYKFAFWNGGQDKGSTLKIIYASKTEVITAIQAVVATNNVGVYDLAGRKADESVEGVLIVDGVKKYVVK